MVLLDFSEFEIINTFIKVFNSDFVTIDKILLNFSRRGSRGRRRRSGYMENRIHERQGTIEGELQLQLTG